MYAFFQELFHTGLYKRSQGRVTRQITFGAVALAVVLGLWRLSQTLMVHQSAAVAYGIPGVLLFVGLWAGYRVVNVPQFADFLIAVEAEMNKVSWPGRAELYRSCIVVLVTLVLLAAVLFGFDLFWWAFFKQLGVLGA